MSKQVSSSSIAVLSLCFALMLFTSIGCKGDGFSLAPVSGTVTVDGEPVGDLKIVFYPKSSKENVNPGPFSTGKTDSEGKFTMVSRSGEPGAVVGPHRVGFELPGDMDESALGEAQADLEELTAEGDADAASVKAARDKIAAIRKKMKGFAFVPARYLSSPIISVEVPAEGLSDYAVELTKKE